MPDIFLSYSRQDVAVAGAMAAVLAAAGHDVWWDREIHAGDVYDQVLENALRASRLVIVLWSKTAVVSDWVRSEATVAMQSGTLMPVMIEACQRPVAFELRQSADLIGWKGNEKDPRLAAVLAEVARQLGAPATVAKAVPAAGPNRRLVIGGAAGVAALAVSGFGAWQAFGGKADDGTASVVVLPFANLSGDPEQAYFSDGIAEELRNALAQIRGLKVIGRVSSEKFRDTDDLPATAAKLGVDHVLTGSVRRSATTIRIGAQLVDGRTGVESWSQSYDQPVGDSLAIQSKIANSVVATLSARLSQAAGTIMVGGTTNPQAQELFLKATTIFFRDGGEAGLREMLPLLDKAIALDPQYADAWAVRGQMKSNLRQYAKTAAEQAALLKLAMAERQRAVALAPNSGNVRALYAIGFTSTLDMRRMLAEGERALALAPAEGRVLNAFAENLRYLDPDRAVGISRQAVTIDPFNPFWLDIYSSTQLAARRFSEAADTARNTLAFSKDQRGGANLFDALLAMNQMDAARAILPKIRALPTRFAATAILAARATDRVASDAALANLRQSNNAFINMLVATVHSQRGETEAALVALETAWQRKESALSRIAITPYFDPIRSEPRFKAVQDKIIPPDLFVRPAAWR